MEQDIDKIINDLEMALLTDLYGHITTLVKKEDLEHLIKAYKELEEKNKKNLIEIICYQEELENSFPVSLVEETIEELNKKEKQELKGLKGQDRYFVKQMYQYKRNILQELLEKRK